MDERINKKPIDDNELEYIYQRRNSDVKKEDDNPKKNAEGYSDPTPYEAIKHIDENTAAYHRYKKLLRTIWYICDQANFRIEGRVVLRDKSNGRIWR